MVTMKIYFFKSGDNTYIFRYGRSSWPLNSSRHCVASWPGRYCQYYITLQEMTSL